MGPLISVIVPIYNVEPYIEKCLISLKNQSFEDFEALLIDDGSPDGSAEIARRFSETDERFVFYHKENGGLSDARNAGIDWAMQNSESAWLAFVDSDDYLHSDYLAVLYKTAQKASADLVICDYCRVDDQDEIIEESPGFFDLTTSDKEVLFSCLDENWRIVPAWNKLYAKSIFAQLRFAVGKIHEDEFAIHHVLWACTKAAIVSQALYYYRSRQSSIMATRSTASRLDGLEAAIEQYEFCLAHHLPPRHVVIGVEYLNDVMDLGTAVDPADRARYHDLKKRYERIYLSGKKSRSLKGLALFYLNSICMKAYGTLRIFRKKDGAE